MVPEIGNFALILALGFALIQSFAPLIAFLRSDKKYLHFSTVAGVGQLLFLCIAMSCLILSFITNDMTVLFVREHSHPLLPLIYKIGAAWGGHEGSLLLWCLMLSGWTCVFIIFSQKKLMIHYYRILSILGLMSTGFLIFAYLTSNPFQRDFPQEPVTGNDLVPLLQDLGLIFHPPMLYLGYVGFSICFAFAISALLEGKLDKYWAKACRPWVILPWFFLGCGIILGSWWAYRELGWGGWWFWDPVENASLLPWLVGTALIHSLIVTEKRGIFKGWSLLLALIIFSLSLIGTFLVRSGILISVHAFASDPTRGIYLLSFLALLILSALSLYTWRMPLFYRAPHFQVLSRETLLLLNSIILLTAMFTIILGTLYPIILDMLQLEKISVGEPYFNTVFFPLMLPLLILMGFAPYVHWSQNKWKKIWPNVRLPIFISGLLSILIPKWCGFPLYFLTTLGIFLGVWILTATLFASFQKKFSFQHLGMIIAHLGFALMVLAIAFNRSYSEEKQVKICPGETARILQYQFTFNSLNEEIHKNYKSIAASFTIKHAHHTPTIIKAEERIYFSHEQTLSKPGITFNLFRDIYLALGNIFTDGSLSVRIYYKPLIRWIWYGGFILLLGGIISLIHYFHPKNLSQNP